VVNAPTPSSPDPGRPRRSHRYDGRGARSQPSGQPADPYDGHGGGPHGGHGGDAYGGHGPYGGHGASGGQDPYGRDVYGGHDPYGEDAYGGYGDAPYGGGGEPGAYGAAYPADSGRPADAAASPHVAHEQPPGPDVRHEVRSGLLCALAVGLLGVALGLLWLWLAPRVPLVAVDGGVFLKDPEGEEAIGADGTFVLLALGFGVVTGTLAFLRSREGGVGLVTGLAVGALLGSVLAWQLGVWLGPDTDIAAAAKAAGANKTFDGPLKLQAKSALLVWPLLALLVHLALTGLFGKRDAELDAGAYPGPGTPPPGGEAPQER
jgi:hypothetical protein